MASDYCYSKEMQRALERHQAGTCRVIPILLRPTHWQGAPFSTLQLLPIDAKPITSWQDRDEAFKDVVLEISRTIESLLLLLKPNEEEVIVITRTIKIPHVPFKTKEEWINEGMDLYNHKRYEEALAAYEAAIRLDPNFHTAYYNKGDVLRDLKHYKEALAAYEQTIRLNPNYIDAYYKKGLVLHDLRRYEEAQVTFEHAMRLDPKYGNK